MGDACPEGLVQDGRAGTGCQSQRVNQKWGLSPRFYEPCLIRRGLGGLAKVGVCHLIVNNKQVSPSDLRILLLSLEDGGVTMF